MSHSSPSSSRRSPNRLANETSPYLLQHAFNPVDWFPWGDEAFDKAKREDKPVFLSVGYSACHWCHVMERESFENDEIAAILNERFVSIKVDREERPDVDQIYMAAVQALTQRGGWPMSVFMTPDKQPFFGGTYWPPTSRMGMRGFREILELLSQYWGDKRSDVLSSAASLTQAVQRMTAIEFEEQQLSEDVLRGAQRALLQAADPRDGGFGGAPKFPHPMDLRVLLRCWKRFENSEAMAVVRLTLDKMANGGIYDHLGGGFHRYSTDAHWLVPHFEKMLYDNALLVPVYLEAYQAQKHPDDRRVVRETLDYILREMTSPDGGFYSTQDADTEGEEGRFFIWGRSEIESLLGPEDAKTFCYAYDVTGEGNWEGQNILNRPKTAEQAARILGLTPEALEAQLAKSRAILLEARNRRVRPGRDEKVLTGWNGLMIAAFAKAAAVLNDSNYAEAATRAADFVLSRLQPEPGKLLHSYKDGRARFTAYLDDYACLIDALVELYQATFDARWLESAVVLAEGMSQDFVDSAQGGFFYTASHHEQLIARSKDVQDNATPSGNGMAAYALLRLGRLTGRTDLEELGYRTLQSVSGLMVEHPRAAGQSLMALDFHLGPAPEVLVLDNSEETSGDELLRAARSEFCPNLLTGRAASSAPTPPVLAFIFSDRKLIDGKTTAYVCERGVCREPCTDAGTLRRLLNFA